MTYLFMASMCRSPAARRNRGYLNVAIVELNDGFDGIPKMISTRAKGIKRIVEYHSSLFVGLDRGKGREIVNAMKARVETLNSAKS